MLRKVDAESIVSSDVSTIADADKLILPGVGAFDSGMRHLNESGLIPLLEDKVLKERTPVLGLCLGMQLFTKKSEEGSTKGLGWIDANTVRFKFSGNQQDLRIPHMGWRSIRIKKPCKIFDNMHEESRYYFVHSYHVQCQDEQDVLSTTYYGIEFNSMIMRENIIGAQFHPEKSHKFGMILLKNFVNYF